jgi:FlaA1/EpsC-like NDP-sugar epimerase
LTWNFAINIKDKIDIIPVIGDIQDRECMFEVMEEHKPDVVYHAAAHKYFPLYGIQSKGSG